MISLTVVIDPVAAMRDTLQLPGINPVAVALRAEAAGADGIGVYLRENHRPISERDVRLLRQSIHGRLVLHMAATSEMVGLALEVKPERVVLMPDLREDGTTEDGLDVMVNTKLLTETVDTLQSNGISVGVCVAAQPDLVKVVHQARANWIQIHAGRLAAATSAATQTQEFNRMVDTVKMAHRLRLHIAIAHGLDHRLIKLFSGLTEIDELSIGRSLMAQALIVGIDTAVRDMVGLIRAL
ncbi:MAG: pyridoxine 5'-phosphate synthase [Desulfobacteraceae bacterium]|nr:pyridoxine 5'-phosphate synthase [Desulfobacteraceae bacterium]